MKYRLYCIFEAPETSTICHTSPSEQLGVQAVKRHGLCATFSEVSSAAGPDDVSKLMRHHRVIESFFERVTVVPFRFDTVLEDLSDLEMILEQRRDFYIQTLRRLNGSSEMGIRAIMRESGTHPPSECRYAETIPSETPHPGTCYLQKRKVHYADESLSAERNEQLGKKFCAAFGGMFKEFRSDPPKLDVQAHDHTASVFSLYYLVPKNLITSFRHQFAAIASMASVKLLLSGPWPPYNFVLPKNPQLK